MNKLVTIFLLAISTVLFAQDQVAKDVLDKLSTKTESYKNMTIGFDFIFRNISQNINRIVPVMIRSPPYKSKYPFFLYIFFITPVNVCGILLII